MIHPTTDTFEQDIVKEIHQKEASIMDIASSIGDISNRADDAPSKNSWFLIMVSVLVFCGIGGASYLGYVLYTNTFSQNNVPVAVTKAETKTTTSGVSLSQLSPAINKSVGQFLTNTQKMNAGYTIDIISYSPVFAYMLRNEKEFGDEIAQAVGNTHTIKNKPAIPVTITPVTSSSTATSTQATSTSTATTTEGQAPITEYVFSDITINNQNMRVATCAYGTVAYAFVGTNTLIISSSPEGILALRNSVLKK